MTYLQPVFPLLLLLVAAGLLAGGRRGRRLAVLACVALFLWSWPPVSRLFSGTLERRYPLSTLPPADADAIVVLSSAVRRADPSQALPALSESNYLRCRHAAWLYRNWRAVPIVASGGSGGANLIIARVMREELEAEGVPSHMILTEERSRSTYENAVFSAEILRARGIRRIALVTETYHMPRSEKCFRKQDLEVVPAPCCSRSLQFSWDLQHLIPGARPMLNNSDSLHEWIGLIWYRLSGKI